MTGAPREERQTAIALSYHHGEDVAPRVTAAGHGEVAERILEVARREGIPLREDPDLAEALSALDLDQLVPPELYRVIAEVMAWAYRANGRYLLPETTSPHVAPDGDAGAPPAR